MPFSGFENFEACVVEMKTKEGYTDEIAKKVCGKLQSESERANSTLPQNRELRFNFSIGKFQELDGGLLIKDVKLLAAGTWIDSNVGTPLNYSTEVLQRYYSNWIDSAIWSRHNGGVPRDITDKVGDVRNQRFENDSIIGDLFLHGKTQKSRDTTELVKAGIANFVSVEHGGKERWNVGKKQYEAEDLVFGGVAIVNKGACTVCTISNESKSLSAEAEMTEIKELETKLAETERQLAGASVAIKTLQDASAGKDTKITELERQLGESKTKSVETTRQLEDIVKRVDTLEKIPAPKSHVGRDGHELSAKMPEFIKLTKGEISMERI